MRRLILLALLCFSALVTAQDTENQVEPIVDCVIDFGNGQRVAVFRYHNPDTSPVIAQAGEDNYFTPEVDVDAPQIIYYTPRPDSPDVRFEVPFSGDELTWTLLGQSVTASDDSPLCEPERSQSISVEAETTYQTITGFGGAYVFRFSKIMDGGGTDNVAPLTLEYLRPTHMRFHMALDTFEASNDNDDPFTFNWDAYQENERMRAGFAFMQLAQETGALIHVSSWIAPDWMVSNPESGRQRVVREDAYDELAESIVAYVLYVQNNYGVTIDTVSLNEPDLGIFQIYSPQEQVEVMRLVNARFAEEGLPTKWAMAETSNMADALDEAEAIWANEDIRDSVTAWAYHSWDTAGNTVLQRNADFATENDLEVWVTEVGYDAQAYETPEVFPTFDFALQAAQIYSRLYKLSGMNVPFHWQFLDDYRVISQDGTEFFPSFYVLWSLRQFVPVGSQVIDTSEDRPGMYSFAIQTPEGDISLMIVNTTPEKQATKITDLPEGTYQHYRMNDGELLVNTGEFANDESAFFLMAQSVNWFTTIDPGEIPAS